VRFRCFRPRRSGLVFGGPSGPSLSKTTKEKEKGLPPEGHSRTPPPPRWVYWANLGGPRDRSLPWVCSLSDSSGRGSPRLRPRFDAPVPRAVGFALQRLAFPETCSKFTVKPLRGLERVRVSRPLSPLPSRFPGVPERVACSVLVLLVAFPKPPNVFPEAWGKWPGLPRAVPP
jgi:hypothetical protein